MRRTQGGVLKPDDYKVDPNTGCWVWQKVTNDGGYGRCRRHGRAGGVRPAHRVYYEELVGPVPEGLVLDHLCRNRLCVNPDHLEPVTGAENSRRGERAKISFQDARCIHFLWRHGFSQATIGVHFGLNQATACRILTGQRWAGTNPGLDAAIAAGARAEDYWRPIREGEAM